MRLNLKFAIIASGKSQREIAAMSDIPENRFSGLVRGWAEPREREREAIAASLGKSEAELFTEERPGLNSVNSIAVPAHTVA